MAHKQKIVRQIHDVTAVSTKCIVISRKPKEMIEFECSSDIDLPNSIDCLAAPAISEGKCLIVSYQFVITTIRDKL